MAPWIVPAFYVLASALGGAIGSSELVSRYRDDPARALRTAPAILYIVINAGASLAAMSLSEQFGWIGKDETGLNHLILVALATGLGAMALFRTSLFTLRVGNSDISIGPAAFLQILLAAADRAVDRARAKPRASAVQDIMMGISFQKAYQALPSLCFGLMQNVSGDEQRSLGITVQQLKDANMEDVFKVNTLGLALMNVVGESVLREAVNMLRADITAPPKAIIQSIPTLQLLRNFDFDSSSDQVIDECVFLTNKLRDDGLRAKLSDSQAKITAMTVSKRQKGLLLSAILVGEFGEDTVQTVLRSLPENASVSGGMSSGGATSQAPPSPP